MKRYLALCLMVACAADVPVGQVRQRINANDCGTCTEDVPDCEGSPILLDLNGDGYQMTDSANGVIFDLRNIHKPMRVGWTAAKSDDAWLVLDWNNNGLIDGGREMFGNESLQAVTPHANGFPALAVFDENGDGSIDARDPVYDRLRLWQDTNHDGVSQPEELLTLESRGVMSIGLAYSTVGAWTDGHGNSFREHAPVTYATGWNGGTTAWDVWVHIDPLAPTTLPDGTHTTNEVICGGSEPPDQSNWHCYAKCYKRVSYIFENSFLALGLPVNYSECSGNGWSDLAGLPTPGSNPVGTFYSLGGTRVTNSAARNAAVQQCVRDWMTPPPGSLGITCEQCSRGGQWASRGGSPLAEAYGCFKTLVP